MTAGTGMLLATLGASIAREASAGGAVQTALRATGGETSTRGGNETSSGSTGGGNRAAVEELDANARESETAAAIRRGARVKLTDERAEELIAGPMMGLYGGLDETGETTNALDVLTGSSSGDYLVWCHRGEEKKSAAPAIASAGVGLFETAKKVIFHGGYKVWDSGSEFEDVSSTHALDTAAGAFECLTSGGSKDGKAALGKTNGDCPRLQGDRPSKRDEEVAVITAKPIHLSHSTDMAMLGKHLERRELPALDVNDEDDEGDNGVASTGSNESSEDGEDSNLGKGTKQHALIVFGGRDEDDQRLDTLYALGLDDKQWRKIEFELPDKRDDMVPQGPFEMPMIVKHAHENGKPFPLGRSGATAVVTKDNRMIIYGGFVVEGRLGFNVGEILSLNLDTMKFSYPMVSGSLPVRRNKHSAILDDKQRMWIWGGSVWDHTGGSSTYASTATYYADVSNPKSIVWHRVETKGKPPSQRRFHNALFMDGAMYIIGGEDYRTRTYLSDAHRLDLNTLTWTQPAVLGGIKGGRIRASAFPWIPADAHVKEAALGKSHHHHKEEEDEDEDEERAKDEKTSKKREHSKKSEDKDSKKMEGKRSKRTEDKQSKKSASDEDDDDAKGEETRAGLIDASTCGTGETARVRTGENQPDIEHLISVLVDGSTSKLGQHDTDDEAALAASLTASGWLPNTARSSDILSESSMLWRKAPDVGSKEGLPGWITDSNGRDKSVLTETLAADPEASNVEARLLQAIKSVRETRDVASKEVADEHRLDKLAEEESKIGKTKAKTVQDEVEKVLKRTERKAEEDEAEKAEKEKPKQSKSSRRSGKDSKDDDHAKLSKRDDKAAERKDDRNSKRKSSDDDDGDDVKSTHKKSSRSAADDEDRKSKHGKKARKEEDDDEDNKSKHGKKSLKRDDDDEDHKSKHGKKALKEEDDDEDEEDLKSTKHKKSSKKGEDKLHLSAAAKMLEKIQKRGEAAAHLGAVSRVTSNPAHVTYFWSTISVVAIAAAIAINFMPAKRRDRAASQTERIPLVPSSSSMSDSPNTSAAKWQRDAMARRGIAYGDFDEFV